MESVPGGQDWTLFRGDWVLTLTPGSSPSGCNWVVEVAPGNFLSLVLDDTEWRLDFDGNAATMFGLIVDRPPHPWWTEPLVADCSQYPPLPGFTNQFVTLVPRALCVPLPPPTADWTDHDGAPITDQAGAPIQVQGA